MRRLAWALFGLTCGLALVEVALVAVSDRPLLSTQNIADGFPLVTLGAVAGAGIGALVVSRYPRHRVGWLLILGQLGTVFGVAAQAYANDASSGRLGAAPGGHLAVWLSVQTGAIFAITLLAVLFLIAPDGHLLSARWRGALLLSVLGLVLSWTAVAFVPPGALQLDGTTKGHQPPVVDVLITAGAVAVLLGLMAGTWSLVRRLRAASGEQRAQLRWVAAAAAAVAGGVLAAVVLGQWGVPSWIAVLPLMTAYLCVPVFTGVAILRFRLYDLDLLVGRAIVLALLTGTVAVGYVVVVLTIGRLVGAHAEGRFWPSLLATALVALGVQPARRRLSQLADRLVYGDRAAPYEALADFSRRLAERSLDDLVPRLAESVGRAVSARQVEITVEVPGRPRSRTRWPDGPGRAWDVVLPVTSGVLVLGRLGVAMPAGRPLRGGESRLLDDFVVQLGRAFGNRGLESELADQVDRLSAQAAELEASAQRLRAAQAAGRRRFEEALTRDVLPHLTGLPDQLSAAHAAAQAAAARRDPTAPLPDLDVLVGRTTSALTALRTLTRGVFPSQLEHRGLVPALASHLEHTGFPGLAGAVRAVDAAGTRRFGATVEDAAYFCAVEFLRELDVPDDVTLSVHEDLLALTITGTARPTLGSSTRHLADRIAALDGSLTITGSQGPRATLVLVVPALSADRSEPGVEEHVGAEG